MGPGMFLEVESKRWDIFVLLIQQHLQFAILLCKTLDARDQIRPLVENL